MFLEWQVENEEDGLLLRTFLRSKHISKQLLTAVKFSADGKIEVNRTEQNVLYQVQTGDNVRLTFPTEQQNERLLAEYTKLEVIFEDDFLLIINKPAGMASIPSQYHPSGSVANFVKGHYEAQGLTSAIHIVTRLDRDTSGLMLIAKNRFAHARLSTFLQQGLLKRRYQALTSGVLQEEAGSIEAPIGRKEVSIMERFVTPEGKYAKTNYEVLKRYRGFDHVAIQLETGRTHQIRVHFSYIGHPLIGDDMYGGDTSMLQRQALHSCHLHLVHPVTEEYMAFDLALPDDLEEIIQKSE
ncbi:RluA family pseudouridine synthase [Listeria welshimeri]|uniref:Pseudouridine synthase n=1 Tax=Listeria welshimeri serovar 6b (strain ATCC 35897 / DSM 20650 / CCUG 15529 / CIP 8149 / NCTC 11857 / SLCC 5334 / V8) TaxID=386043 RepID=A0AH87_LISW6|nr:RluA family pseudouridine synthase [Listeria welshimeri]MBC1409481.1 RluA family pseudouridine synthase [Listeria welshimeri]MBC1632575.1 RluA family pseudouridine synthase [Listeria welshimeri]MBC1643484.1 RluA family pseudouridine synthase [Listeria welshimeri]MBC1652340.1 RluA family pseudouridine synthase [Listeria welshimeri]MBC1657726.1 RluA family pseudouridine synthase [Listeria welshimeri]